MAGPCERAAAASHSKGKGIGGLLRFDGASPMRAVWALLLIVYSFLCSSIGPPLNKLRGSGRLAPRSPCSLDASRQETFDRARTKKPMRTTGRAALVEGEHRDDRQNPVEHDRCRSRSRTSDAARRSPAALEPLLLLEPAPAGGGPSRQRPSMEENVPERVCTSRVPGAGRADASTRSSSRDDQHTSTRSSETIRAHRERTAATTGARLQACRTPAAAGVSRRARTRGTTTAAPNCAGRRATGGPIALGTYSAARRRGEEVGTPRPSVCYRPSSRSMPSPGCS
jgi:hypothetical protein